MRKPEIVPQRATKSQRKPDIGTSPSSSKSGLFRSKMISLKHRNVNQILWPSPESYLGTLDKWLAGSQPEGDKGQHQIQASSHNTNTNTRDLTMPQIRASDSQIDHFAGPIDWRDHNLSEEGRQIVSQCAASPNFWLHFEPTHFLVAYFEKRSICHTVFLLALPIFNIENRQRLIGNPSCCLMKLLLTRVPKHWQMRICTF